MFKAIKSLYGRTNCCNLYKERFRSSSGCLVAVNDIVDRCIKGRQQLNSMPEFKKAIKESCVKPIRLHDLRHSHATILINEGVNIVAVSKRLGHTDINQTLKTYTHLLKNTDEQMMETINSIVSKKNN